MRSTVSPAYALPPDRLHFDTAGRCEPDELVAALVDGDARAHSSGLVYVAEHTDARVLNEQAADRIAGVLARTAAIVEETGATPEQAEALAEIARIIIESGDPGGAARQLLGAIRRDTERQLAELGVQLVVAEGDFPEDAVFLSVLVDGRRVAVVPPCMGPRQVLIRVRSLLAAMGAAGDLIWPGTGTAVTR